jgi:restriction endonuclease Mrr
LLDKIDRYTREGSQNKVDALAEELAEAQAELDDAQAEMNVFNAAEAEKAAREGWEAKMLARAALEESRHEEVHEVETTIE